MSRALLPLALLAVLAVALAAASPARANTAAPALAAGEIYLALGDSLSTGEEAAGNNDGLPGYPAALNNLLQSTTPLTYTVQAVNGETTTGMLAPGGQLDRATAYIAQRRAAGERVGLITLSVGGNDIVNVLRGDGGTITSTLALMRANLSTILDRLIAATTADGQREARILVQNYYNPYPGQTIRDFPPFVDLPPDQEPIVTDRDLPKFNRVLLEVALQRCVAVVDAFSIVRGNEGQYLYVNPSPPFPPSEADLDYHPRPAGHAALAAANQARLNAPDCQRAFLPALARPAATAAGE